MYIRFASIAYAIHESQPVLVGYNMYTDVFCTPITSRESLWLAPFFYAVHQGAVLPMAVHAMDKFQKVKRILVQMQNNPLLQGVLLDGNKTYRLAFGYCGASFTILSFVEAVILSVSRDIPLDVDEKLLQEYVGGEHIRTSRQQQAFCVRTADVFAGVM